MTIEEMKAVILTIVTPLLHEPESLQVKTSEDRRSVTFHLHLAADDVGRIIGKQGQVVQAIRTLIYGIRLDSGKHVRLNIVDNK